MKVTVCQLEPRDPRLDEQLAALRAHITAHASQFVLLPELCFSPWLPADPTPDAERWARAVAHHERRLARLASLGARAVMGTRPVVTPTGSRRNQAYTWMASEDRVVPLHDKHHLPDEDGYWEHSWYDRGPRRFDVARILGMRVGVQICTEMWFFEWARHYAAERADLLCVPRATPHATTAKWLAGGRAAAVCAGAFCLSSNLWYPPGEIADCGGMGWIIDPDGDVLATTDTAHPFATVDIDLAVARSAKSTYPRYVAE